MTSGINGWKKREFEEASLRVKNFITKRIEEEELLTKGKREGERKILRTCIIFDNQYIEYSSQIY